MLTIRSYNSEWIFNGTNEQDTYLLECYFKQKENSKKKHKEVRKNMHKILFIYFHQKFINFPNFPEFSFLKTRV